MNKTAIKNFAIWARRKLIADITYKAGMVGVSENGIAQPLPQSTRDLQFFDIGTKNYAEVSGVAIEQRNALVKVIQTKEQGTDYKTAFQNVVEEVAYTWFNRLIAVRFMEVNDYLPSKIRVLSSENEGKLEPDFVTTPFETDLEFSPYERDLVLQLKDNNKLDELFRMLFIKQCNKLSVILPGLFEKISDYTELLLNISFTDKDGIVYHLTHDISEDEFNVETEGQVEIIGWMYQYYCSDLFNLLYDGEKATAKIESQELPSATQLFTPDWIVQYMVENSLGRVWMEGHPNEQIKSNWKYYLEEAEQEPEGIEQLKKIREAHVQLNPTDIKVIDPCMGSGHILVYAFDVLMQIYKSQGYIERDAAKLILNNNLYGIDIDMRAYQLAYFAVMMKARQYNRKIFQENITPNLIAINNPESVSKSVLKWLSGLETVALRMLEDFEDAKEYGSILKVSYTEDELLRLERKLEEIEQEAQYGNLLVQMEVAECVRLVRPLIKQARLLAQKYEVVVTNPPYLNANRMNAKLSAYINQHYKQSKQDLALVMYQAVCDNSLAPNAYVSFITPSSWMFSSKFRDIRVRVVKTQRIVSIVDCGTELFAGKVGHLYISAWVAQNHLPFGISRFVNVSEYCYSRREEKPIQFFNQTNQGVFDQGYFEYLPDMPMSYNISPQALQYFTKGDTLSDEGNARQGLTTSDNKRFTRSWFEVNYQDICWNCNACQDTLTNGMKWFPFLKGGDFQKWYQRFDTVVNYANNGEDIKKTVMEKYPYLDNPGFVVKNTEWYFQQGISWNDVGGERFNARLMPTGYIFADASPSYFPTDGDVWLYLAYFNSSVFQVFANAICQGLHYSTGQIPKIPVKTDILLSTANTLRDLAQKCYKLVGEYVNENELSVWFSSHVLVSGISSLKERYEAWKNNRQAQRNCLITYEEQINHLFAEAYGIENICNIIDPSNISIQMPNIKECIVGLLSYAVGCIFGRYSLDAPGLAYAGGEWDTSKYSTFVPDADNCIPITDTEYFQDDIVGCFVEFVRVVYGIETLEDNLNFIAKALGNKGNTSREVIRNYFLNDFYKDHLKMYQKRPIYWLFDSGKQNGFKALVYMHRWNADTVGNVRVEYLHKMQTVYEHEIDSCQDAIEHGNGHEIAVATRRKEKLIKQLKECKDYDTLVSHIALSRIDIDLDDGVKMNYRKVQTGTDGKFCEILANSKDIMAKEK